MVEPVNDQCVVTEQASVQHKVLCCRGVSVECNIVGTKNNRTQSAASHTIYHASDFLNSAGGFHLPALETGRFPAATMSFLLQSWHILLAAICGLLNQRQQQIIEFQNARIEALLKKHGKQRLLLDNDQRRLLAVKGQAIGRKALLIVKELFSRWSVLTLRGACSVRTDTVVVGCGLVF